MSDIATVYSNESMHGDVRFDGLALETDDRAVTAGLHCLLCDARAPEGLTAPDGDRRGWLGDCLDPDPQDPGYGNLRWLLARGTQTEEVRRRFEDYDRQALQVLVDKGVWSEFDLTESYPVEGMIRTEVRFTTPDGRSGAFGLARPWSA